MNKDIKIFIYSLLFINLYNWISIVEFKYGIPSIFKYILSVSAIGAILYYKILYPSKPDPGRLFYPVIAVFTVWTTVMLISAILKFNSFFFIQRIFGQRYFFLPYVLPLFLLYTRFNLAFFSRFFYYSFLFIIPAALIQVIIIPGLSVQNLHENIQRIGIFDIGSSFLLLTAHISKRKYISAFALLYFFLMIILSILWGRRGMLIEYGLLLIFMTYIRLRSSLVIRSHRFKIYISVLSFIILILALGYLFENTLVFQRGFSKAGFEESRGLVLEDFFIDFKSNSDWIFGRGLDGTILRTIDTETGTENFIENGFLTIILKGGLFYLIPFILILLRASYVGFYKSNNDLSMALAAILLIHLVIMFTFNLPDYSSKYIFIWIAISASFTREIRQLSNDEIYEAINA